MSPLESVPLREWGTRYDSLSTSPSPSTASSLSRLPQTTTRPPSANVSLVTPVAVSPTKSHAQGNRLLHEASVFVGSLPTNVDHEELSSRLKDHLSVYGDVKFVRIIRDSRGGICAFVQCNDSASAAQLLQTVRSMPPQSFMGRYLRFEPARSQRTLWISYRKPTEVISDADHGRSDPSFNWNGRVVEFDLPNAMRVCRAPGSRRVTILYNAQAVHFPGIITTSHSPQEQDLAPSVLTSTGLFLSPLQFDSQTLEQIASHFGPLESFDLRQPEHTEDAQVYSYPHNADRSEGMDPGCWEIKWENRNDCLSALATLRSVPHLTVTWPNQQHALMPRRTGTFNRSHNVKDNLVVKRQSGLRHGQLRRDNDHDVTGQIFTALDSASYWKHNVNTAVTAVGSQASSEHLSPPSNGDPLISTDDWTIIDPCVNTGFQVRPAFPDAAASNQLQASRVHQCGVLFETEDGRERQGDDALCLDEVPSSQLSNLPEWSEAVSDPEKGDVATPSPSSPLHVPGYCGDTQSPSLGSVAVPTTPFVENLASPFIQRSPRPANPNVRNALDFYDTFAIPPAIEWPETRSRGPSAPCDENIDVNLRNIPDQTTIFVGGLEVHGRCTWDEERLKRIFGQYGEIVEVKLVRPAHRKSAFAFVTYKSNKSSSQAVLAEHDRIYDGRHIRVQLRDNAVQKAHASKSSVKSSGGREGRPFSPRHHYVPRIDSSPADTLLPVQNDIGPAVPVPREEPAPSLPLASNGATSVHSDTRGQVPENVCMPLIPSQASSTMVSYVPPMTYPRLPPTAFYAPAPWFMHPYPYGPPPPIVPGYPPVPLTSPVVGTNETGRPVPSNTIYQPIPHYSVYPLPLHSIHATRQQHVEPASRPERRAPLQPTGFIESEQGLIPVYAPEALGEYMASTHSHQNTPEPGASHSGLHPPRAVLDARSLQPKTIHAMYPQPQYHPAFIRDRSAIMMTAPGQFLNAPNQLSVGTGFNWYHDTSHPEHRAQDGLWVAADPAAHTVGNGRDMPTGQTPRSQIYSERGFGFSKRRGQIDRSTPMRASKGDNPPAIHTTRRRGYFKHAWGAVSMSAVADQTAEMGLGDGASISDPVVRASTSSPAVFDLTPTSTQGTQT